MGVGRTEWLVTFIAVSQERVYMKQEARTVEFDGFSWELRLPSNIDTEIAEGRWWDIEVHDWIVAHVTPGMICVDAGANFGVFTMLLARAVGPKGWVYAFEPCPNFVGRLRRHMEINGLHNVSVYAQALGGAPGAAVCVQDGAPYHSTARVRSVSGGAGEVAVEVVALDTFFAARRAPGFIKIDVDGCESAVLEGARRLIEQAKPIIVIEIPLSEDGVEIGGWLTDRGYDLTNGRGSHVEPRDLMKGRGESTWNVWAMPDGPGTWNEEM